VPRRAPPPPRDGLREYYDPLTGRGLGARDFGWSTLLLDLVGSG
jgi:hypothetical protein